MQVQGAEVPGEGEKRQAMKILKYEPKYQHIFSGTNELGTMPSSVFLTVNISMRKK